jgi:hypothetical protein
VDPSEPRATPCADPQPASGSGLFRWLAWPARTPFRRLAFSTGWPPAQPYLAHSRRRDRRIVDPFGALPAPCWDGSHCHGHDLGPRTRRIERTGCSWRYARSAAPGAYKLGVGRNFESRSNSNRRPPPTITGCPACTAPPPQTTTHRARGAGARASRTARHLSYRAHPRRS